MPQILKLNPLLSIVLSALLLVPSLASADQINENQADHRTVVTLGKDLSTSERQEMLREFGSPEAQIIEVSNAEEHEALSGLLPAKTIGSRAISSSLVTLKDPGYGIHVSTNNITAISSDMYSQALSTAGIKDAAIQVAAPFPVSGTAALTGIMKAFEKATDTQLNSDQKKTALEEMVVTSKLAKNQGDQQKAVELLKQLKTELAKHKLNEDQMSALIDQLASQIGLSITPEEKASLISLGMKLQNLNVDWDQVAVQTQQLLSQAKDYLHDHPETKSWIVAWWDQLKKWVDDFFGSL